MRDDVLVKRWLLSLPGTFQSLDSAEDCIKQAWGASGLQIVLPQFKDALKRCGYEVQQRRTYKHGYFVLPLPSSGVPRRV